MFTAYDVEEAMRASKIIKGLGPDGFKGTILKRRDAPHLSPRRSPPRFSACYLSVSERWETSAAAKITGKDLAELKDNRQIGVRSRMPKILEKILTDKVAAVAPSAENEDTSTATQVVRPLTKIYTRHGKRKRY
jgi:hypothetical protein